MTTTDHINLPTQVTPTSTEEAPARPLVTFAPERMVITLAPEAMQGLAALMRGAEAFALGVVQVTEAALPYLNGFARLVEAGARAARPVIAHIHEQLGPAILRWEPLLQEAAAAAVRLAPRLHEWRMRLKELNELAPLIYENKPFLYCAMTEWALREHNDLASLQEFSNEILGIKVAPAELLFVAEAFMEPWAQKRDPVAYLRAVVRLRIRLARKNPEADPRSPQYLPRKQRRGDGISLVLLDEDDADLLDSEDHGAQHAFDEALLHHSLARTELRPEAQRLLVLRLNGATKAKAAQLLGWSMTAVEVSVR